jgi:RNase H-fold protein (predicted Holliday junction resolvase)
MGFALGDTATGVAGPLSVVARVAGEQTAEVIARVARAEQCTHVVVGISGQGPFALQVRAAMETLRAEGFTVNEVDEHLTSRLARTRAAEAGVRTHRHDDAWAAVLIAEDWIGRGV